MRRIAWGLLLAFAFSIPWEFSLDLGPPLGNAARMLGILLLLASVPAVLQAGQLRRLGAVQWLVLALYLWLCCSYFWSIAPDATLDKMRAFFQDMMVVWMVWEFAETPEDLRSLLRAFVAGCSALALLTLADFRSPEAMAAGQFRFAAYGQDPNDVARLLDIGFPFAALLANSESRWPERLLAMAYLPLGLVAVLLTASRGGFVAALVAFAGCAVLVGRGRARAVLTALFGLPPLAAVLWAVVPHETFARLATIPGQLEGGDLNQRLNIWTAGWHAFVRSPLFGSGAGSFVAAAHTAPIDTAHNTVLSLAVSGGLLALALAAAIVTAAVWCVVETQGPLRMALACALAVWVLTSLVGTAEESRTTWLLFGLIALAARLATEDHTELADCFAGRHRPRAFAVPAEAVW